MESKVVKSMLVVLESRLVVRAMASVASWRPWAEAIHVPEDVVICLYPVVAWVSGDQIMTLESGAEVTRSYGGAMIVTPDGHLGSPERTTAYPVYVNVGWSDERIRSVLGAPEGTRVDRDLVA